MERIWQLVAFALIAALLVEEAVADEKSAAALDPIYACASIRADAARLACFDSTVSELQTKENAGLIQMIDSEEVAQIEKDSFGFSLPTVASILNRGAKKSSASTGRTPVENVESAIKSAYLQKTTGRAVITLDNGQTWEQIDSNPVRAATLKKAKQARVRKAALGSYLMSLDDGRAFRVKRTS